MQKARILIADDVELIRRALRDLIECDKTMEVCGEAGNGEETVEMAELLKPDIILLDFAMPDFDGVEVMQRVKSSLPNTQFLIITGQESEQMVYQFVTGGARGFLVKTDDTSSQILPALRALCENKPYTTSRTAQAMFDAHSSGELPESFDAAPGGLVADEREIVKLLADGLSNKDVAAKLGLSLDRVEVRRAAIMEKLGFKNLADLVRYAVRNEIIEA